MNSSDLILYIGSCLFVIAVTAYIFNLVLNIPKLQKHLKAQTDLLTEIAKQKGVSDEKINSIIKNLE